MMTKNSNSRVTQFLAYREFNRYFLTMLGWSQYYYSYAIYRILPYIHLFLSMSTAYVIFRFVKVYYNNIPQLTRGLSFMTSFILISIKMTCLITHKKELFDLHRFLDTNIMNLVKKDHMSYLIFDQIGDYRFLNWGLAVSVFSSCTLFLGLPLASNLKCVFHHIIPSTHIFPYPSIFPWPVPYSGLIYQLHFGYLGLANCTLFVLTVGVDVSFPYFVYLIIGQIREISYHVTHLDKESGCNAVIKKCMTQYCQLIRCCDTLQRIYGPIVLCLMTTNAIVLCGLIYQISQMDSLTIERAALIVGYISSKVFQTFMYSWSGTHLTIESEEYINAIYSCNWYGNRQFMLAMLIMLKQRPLILTVCHFSIVSLDIFLKISKTSLSYFFLLKTLDN